MRGAVCSIAVAAAVAVAASGCGSKRSAAPPAGHGDAAGAAPASQRTDLLAHVPDDTVYVLALRDDVPAPLWGRLVHDLGPVFDRVATVAADELAAGVDDPIERIELGLVADLAGTTALRPRAVLYDLRGVRVLRIQTADAAAVTAVVRRVVGGATTATIDGPSDAVFVAAIGDELVVGRGPSAAVKAMADVLAERAPLPAPALAPDTLERLAADHELAPYAVGYVDFARLGDRLRAAPDLARQLGLDLPPTPACADAIATVLGKLPRLAIGAGATSADRIELVGELALDPPDAAALNAAQTPIAGLPIDGTPLIGFALAGTDTKGGAAWRAAVMPLVGQCKPEAAVAMLAEPFSSMRGFVAAIYDGKMQGFLPAEIDGYAAMIGDDLDGVMQRARSAGLGAGKAPADGAPFAKLSSRGISHGIVPTVEVARRGHSLVFASGPTGRAHAEATLATTTPAPMFQLIVDIGRIVHWQPANADPPSAADLDRDRVLEDDAVLADAGFSAVSKAALSTLAMTIAANARGVVGRIVVGLAPQGATPDAPPPPSAAVRECRRILAAGWLAAEPALDRLGITADRVEIEHTYRTGLDTATFAKDCLALPPAARACIRAGADPLATVGQCDDLGFFAMPPLFSFFGPHPLADRFRDQDRVPLPDENAFLVPLYRFWPGEDGWVVKDATGCAAISEHGEVVAAACVFGERDGERWLTVTAPVPCKDGVAKTCTAHRAMTIANGKLDVRGGS